LSATTKISATKWFSSEQSDFVLINGDAIQNLKVIAEETSAHLVFADPPYFLSNDGITCVSGKMVSVNKGQWDKIESIEAMHDFNIDWLNATRNVLDSDGSVVISGTHHVIHSIGFALQQLRYKLLNELTWEKPAPPPNLSCRYFTHSTETLLWAAKTVKSKHTFNYQAMKEQNGGKQMKTVWKMNPPLKSEKKFGKHPTQKPVELLERIILATTNPDDLIIDPFVGSGTTGIAAVRTGRKFIGIDSNESYLRLAKSRYLDAISQPLLT
jgi:site-specific DNA-methyltransferase (adenine-specific)